MHQKKAYIIANFGGPRSLDEIEPFLSTLLTDRDVVRTKFPTLIHNYLFKKIAKKRSKKIAHDYQFIGGKSPIYQDTEAVVTEIKKNLDAPVMAFHRYLPATHPAFVEEIRKIDADEIRIFPMFPQFTYATTGSIARWFQKNLPSSIVNKMRWVKSYPGHPSFIGAHQNSIKTYLKQQNLKEEETILLFSAHGIPQQFVDTGDVYQWECQSSFQHIMEAFPKVLGRLSYQSKFGPGEWLKPYTIDVCQDIKKWCENRKNVAFVPVSFTSDHIETLFEIETQYMSVIREQGLNAYRIPAFTLDPEWIQSILDILKESNLCANQMLIRP